MDEEKNIKGKEQEDTTGDSNDRDKSETDEKIKQLNEDTERINKAIAENENAKARQKLGGDSNAGGEKDKTKEETPKEYNDRIEKEISEGKHND